MIYVNFDHLRDFFTKYRWVMAEREAECDRSSEAETGAQLPCLNVFYELAMEKNRHFKKQVGSVWFLGRGISRGFHFFKRYLNERTMTLEGVSFIPLLKNTDTVSIVSFAYIHQEVVCVYVCVVIQARARVWIPGESMRERR